MRALFVLLALCLGLGGCATTRKSVLPEKELRFVYEDGTPASGLEVQAASVILDEQNAIARCYPDGTKSWWREYRIGAPQRSRPADTSGSTIIRDSGLVWYEERCPIPASYRGGYELKWAGGEAAPGQAILPLDAFPETLTVTRGVPVKFVVEGPLPALPITPRIFPAEVAHAAAVNGVSSDPNGVAKTGDGEWIAYLKPGAEYVLAFTQRPQSYPQVSKEKPSEYVGYVTDGFVAEAGSTVRFAPGLPASLTLRLLRDPSELNGFPSWPDVYRVVTAAGEKRNVQVSYGDLKFNDQREVTLPNLAPGRYEVRFYSGKGDPYGAKTYSWAEYHLDLASGERRVFAPEFLSEIPSDGESMTYEGRVTDSMGKAIADAKVQLVPGSPETFGREIVRETRSDSAGNYRLEKVRRDAVYTLAVTSPDGTTSSQFLRTPEEPIPGRNNSVIYPKRTGGTFDPLSIGLKSLDGKSLTIGRSEGKPVVVDVWATWCGPCLQAMPKFLETARKYDGQAEFYTLSIDENRDAWAARAAKFGDPAKHAWMDRAIPGPAPKFGIPMTFVYGADGALQASGFEVDVEAELEKMLK